MKKQLPLPGVPKPERKAFTLDGDEHTFDFEVDARPWPMPEAKASEQQSWIERLLEGWL